MKDISLQFNEYTFFIFNGMFQRLLCRKNNTKFVMTRRNLKEYMCNPKATSQEIETWRVKLYSKMCDEYETEFRKIIGEIYATSGGIQFITRFKEEIHDDERILGIVNGALK